METKQMSNQELQQENDYLMENLIRTTIEYIRVKEVIDHLKKYYVMTPKIENKSAIHLGASWNKKAQRFESRIYIQGKKRHLGYFDTSSEAGRAYLVASMNKDKFTTPKEFRALIHKIDYRILNPKN